MIFSYFKNYKQNNIRKKAISKFDDELTASIAELKKSVNSALVFGINRFEVYKPENSHPIRSIEHLLAEAHIWSVNFPAGEDISKRLNVFLERQKFLLEKFKTLEQATTTDCIAEIREGLWRHYEQNMQGILSKNRYFMQTDYDDELRDNLLRVQHYCHRELRQFQKKVELLFERERFRFMSLEPEFKKQSENGRLLYSDLELWKPANPGNINIWNIFQLASSNEHCATYMNNGYCHIKYFEEFLMMEFSRSIHEFGKKYQDSLATLMPQLVS